MEIRVLVKLRMRHEFNTALLIKTNTGIVFPQYITLLTAASILFLVICYSIDERLASLAIEYK